MQKVLIYLSAFCVSFLVIYSVYYYSKAYKLQRSVVVEASELKKTVINPDSFPASNVNIIKYAGYHQVLDSNTLFKIPARHYVGVEGPYSTALLEKIGEAVLKYFPNHPPIDFLELKQGDSLLFSYFFNQAMMPQGFYWLKEPQQMDGIKVRSLMYRSDKADTNKVKLIAGDGFKGIVATLNKYTSAVYILTGVEDYSCQLLKTAEPLAVTGSWSLKRNEAVWLPDIDFFIGKTFPKAEITSEGLSKFKLVNERMKVKTTVNRDEPVAFYGKLEHNEGPVLFYLMDNKTGKAYFSILIRNTEMLVEQRR